VVLVSAIVSYATRLNPDFCAAALIAAGLF
jgi:hypothetical protein